MVGDDSDHLIDLGGALALQGEFVFCGHGIPWQLQLRKLLRISVMLNDYGKSLFKPWASVQNFCWAFALIFITVLVLKVYDLNKSELASWVQALGSIGAIWGALAISRRQLRNQEIAKIDEIQERWGAYLAVIESACKNADKLAVLVNSGVTTSGLKLMWDYHVGELFKTNMSMLKSIPAHDLGSYELVVAHSVMITKMIRIEGIVLSLAELEAKYKRLQPRWVKYQYDELSGDNEVIQDALARYKEAYSAKIELVRSRALA